MAYTEEEFQELKKTVAAAKNKRPTSGLLKGPSKKDLCLMVWAKHPNYFFSPAAILTYIRLYWRPDLSEQNPPSDALRDLMREGFVERDTSTKPFHYFLTDVGKEHIKTMKVPKTLSEVEVEEKAEKDKVIKEKREARKVAVEKSKENEGK